MHLGKAEEEAGLSCWILLLNGSDSEWILNGFWNGGILLLLLSCIICITLFDLPPRRRRPIYPTCPREREREGEAVPGKHCCHVCLFLMRENKSACSMSRHEETCFIFFLEAKRKESCLPGEESFT